MQDKLSAKGLRGDRTAHLQHVATPDDESGYLYNSWDTNGLLSEVAIAQMASFPKTLFQSLPKTNLFFSIDSHSPVALMTTSLIHAPVN